MRLAAWCLAVVGAGGCSDDDASAAAGTDAAAAGHPSTAPDAGHDAGPTAAPCEDTPDGIPTDVFCIGLYEHRDPKRHAKSAQPYAPGVVLWSDGAEKQRYLYLPPSTTIDSSDMDVWKFPVGTKAFKEFSVDGALVETRMFWKRAEKDWVAVTYVWSEDGKSATLSTSTRPLILESGYEIPTRKDCGRCHHGGADKLLGVEAIALALPTAEGMTLASLVADGRLSDPPALTSIALPEDETGKAAAALGYLHANCGMPCHSSRGLGDETNLLLRLRADQFWPSAAGDADAGTDTNGPPAEVATSDAYLAGLQKPPTTASVAQKFPGAVRIHPGDHEQSLLWLLAHRRDMYQMPPLVSHVIDEAGTKLVADWIDALPAQDS
jgi:hypothetical protein